MAKKRITTSRRKPKKNGLVYFFLIPVLFLAIYAVGQPQSFRQEASSDKEKKAGEVAEPTFTSIGDCTANNSCPTPDPAVGAGDPQDTQQQQQPQAEQQEQEEKQPKEEKKTNGGQPTSRTQLIERIRDLLKQLTDGKCQGLAEKIGANSVATGDDISANHNRWHRRNKWKNKKRGLWKLIKCLKKNLEKHESEPAGGGAPQQEENEPAGGQGGQPAGDQGSPQGGQQGGGQPQGGQGQDQPQDQPGQNQDQPQESPTQAPAQQGQQPAGGAATPVAAANVVTGQCGTVISKAQLLNDPLQIGPANGLYSHQPKTQSSCGYTSKTWSGTSDATKYWCTYLIVDAYQLAGFKGLSIGAHAAVVNMRSWWKTASGYKYVENKNDKATMDKVGPGYAIFMEIQAGVFTGKEHVNFIKTKNVDDRGNGTITTLDSNAKAKGRTYTVTNWTITGTSYPVRGFGGH